jgi:hypothetical protein
MPTSKNTDHLIKHTPLNFVVDIGSEGLVYNIF